MNITADTINSTMNLAGGVLALLAAILAVVNAALPKEKTAAAIASLRAKAMSFVVVSSAIASTVSIAVFDSPRLAFFFVFIYATLISVQFLRGQGPATRTETFMLIFQIALVLAFAFFLYLGSLILSVLE